HSAQALLRSRSWVDVWPVPIAGKARGQRVDRSAERAHRGGEYSGEKQTPNANWHFIKNVVAKNFIRRFRQGRVVVRLVKDPQQHADTEKSESNRNVGQTRHDHRAPAAANIWRGQHALYHVLVGGMS